MKEEGRAYGPAPYDDTWALLPNGEDTPFFLSGISWYEAINEKPRGNAYWILAQQYIAAQLNFNAGASSTADVDAAFNAATTVFSTYTPAQVADLPNNERAAIIDYANTLDMYNNGDIGPGHCD